MGWLVGVAWWGWLLIGFYAVPGVSCCIAVFRMKLPLRCLPEEGEEPPRPFPLWLRATLLPFILLALFLLWPVVVWTEMRR